MDEKTNANPTETEKEEEVLTAVPVHIDGTGTEEPLPTATDLAAAMQGEEETAAVRAEEATVSDADTPALPATPKKRRRRFGDRKDGRLVRTIPAMSKFMPYVMPQRCDASNLFSDALDVAQVDKYIRNKVKAGMTNFSVLHVLLAAYVRIISRYPAVNRFVSGQKIYARNNIEFVMTIKKEMRLDSPDTCIKVQFDPADTAEEVYAKFNKVVAENQSTPDQSSSFDKVNKLLAAIPGGILRFVMFLLRCMDYNGHLPKALLNVSPFHGSMIITSMGSLGINPIYHHIYNFGNLPVFLAYGAKYNKLVMDADGKIVKRKYIDFKAVTDERICDGFYYAAAFKYLRKIISDPTVLDNPPEKVVEDID